MKALPFKSNSKFTWYVQLPGRFSADGKRKNRYFTAKEDAETFVSKVKRFGLPAVEKPKTAEPNQDRLKVLVAHALENLDGDASKLFEAIEHFKATRLNIKPSTVREAVEAFQEWRKPNVEVTTWDADRWRLLKLVRAFGSRPLAEVTEEMLRRFFDELKGNPRSVYKSLNVFFEWAEDYNFIGLNPMDKIDPVGKFGVRNDYYKPEVFGRMLRIAAGLEPVKKGQEPTTKYLALLPWFALSGFCGLRSCEAFRLTRKADAIRHSDFYFDRSEPFIQIREEAAKPTRRQSDQRHIETPRYLEALKAWLPYFPTKEGLVVPFTKRKIQNLKAEFETETKIEFIENGFRNSFATYGLNFKGMTAGELAKEMGNSEAVCKRFYIRNLPPGEGQQWFSLRPIPANIIPMAAAAA